MFSRHACICVGSSLGSMVVASDRFSSTVEVENAEAEGFKCKSMKTEHREVCGIILHYIISFACV